MVIRAAVKAVSIVLGIAILVQMLPAYYRSNEFDYYLKRQTGRLTPSEYQLKRDLLLKAREYSLPLQEENIAISTNGGTYRVAVNYTIPINLFLFNHQLKFRSLGGGLLAPSPMSRQRSGD